MKKVTENSITEVMQTEAINMRTEYDFSEGVRSKHYKAMQA